MKRSFFGVFSISLLAAGLFLVAPSATLAQEAVLTRISRNSQIETQMSKMALKNSENADVKKFAKQVIKDNSGIGGRVFSASITYNFHPQIEIPEATSQAEKKMKQAKGADFDKIYLVQMDAFVKDDKDAATEASATKGQGDVSEIGDRLQQLVESRRPQITQLLQEEGFKIE